MVKGQAHRMLLSNGQWQEVCLAIEVLRSHEYYESLHSVVKECVWTPFFEPLL